MAGGTGGGCRERSSDKAWHTKSGAKGSRAQLAWPVKREGRDPQDEVEDLRTNALHPGWQLRRGPRLVWTWLRSGQRVAAVTYAPRTHVREPLNRAARSETCHPPVFQSDELQLRLPSNRPSGRRVARRKSTSLAGAAGLVGRHRRTGEGQRVAAIGLKLRQCLRQVRAKYGWWNRRRVQRKVQ